MTQTLLELGFRLEPGKHGFDLPWPVEDVLTFDPNKKDEETPWWLLALACWHQNRRLVHDLLTKLDVLCRRDRMATHGASALVIAVFKNDFEMAACLLDRGVFVNARTKSGLAAMDTAAATKSVAMLKMLSDRGATMSGTLPSASINKSLQRVLSDGGCPATVDMVLSYYTASPYEVYERFRKACGSHSVDTVSVFLAHGVSPFRENGHRPPLMMALLENDKHGISVARLLLERGAPTTESVRQSLLTELDDYLQYGWNKERIRRLKAGREPRVWSYEFCALARPVQSQHLIHE